MLTIQRWGNSQGIRLPKSVLDMIGLKVGDSITLNTQEDMIILKPEKQKKKKYSLSKLVSQIPDAYQTEEIDWGRVQGKEIW